MRKNVIIVLLAGTNLILFLHKSTPSTAAQDRLIASMTVNRVFHEQINGNWPQAYGSTAEQAKNFEESIHLAVQQGATDWTQYKPLTNKE